MGRRKGTAQTAMALRKRCQSIDCATQTSPKYYLKPIVVLSKLQPIRMHSKHDKRAAAGEAVAEEEAADEVTEKAAAEDAAAEHTYHQFVRNQDNRAAAGEAVAEEAADGVTEEAAAEYAAAEHTYHRFVRSIRNNGTVNSTAFEKLPGSKRLKPGPLSYKRRMLERTNPTISNDTDLPVIARSSAEATSSDCAAPPYQERPLTPLQSALDHDESSHVALECWDRTENPENVRFRFGDVTVNVSPRTYEEDDRQRDEQSNNASDRQKFADEPTNGNEDRRRHIRISAHTVHIHNHFYKS